MPKKADAVQHDPEFLRIIQDIQALTGALEAFSPEKRQTVKQLIVGSNREAWLGKRLLELRAAAAKLDEFIRHLTPSKIERIQITLGQSDSIAKFFAFIFVQRPRKSLAELAASPFFGSGIYAIYYTGSSEPAYAPVSGSETPIYLGKADPATPYAETTLDQGEALFARLSEHANNIGLTSLDLSSFEYRFATVQSGQQAAVEQFLIHLFRPIWNSEMKLAYGVGKHGDAAKTRANKRSPWDTMHPGRKWAANTAEDQYPREEIVARIGRHFETHPPFKSLADLLQALARE